MNFSGRRGRTARIGENTAKTQIPNGILILELKMPFEAYNYLFIPDLWP